MKQGLDFEFPEDMNEEDIQKLVNGINSFTVPMPSEKEINAAIDNLIRQMPARRKKIRDNKIFNLLKIASKEIRFMSSTYWLISFGIFVLGMYSILENEGSIIKDSSPYISAALMSPVPFILSFMEIFKGREEGVAELELSCKISIGEIMLSRLIIICIYNIILNTMVCTALVYSSSGIIFWRATLMWLTPFTLTAGIGLVLVSRMRGSYVTVIFTGEWMVLVMAALLDERITNYITRVNLVVYGILSIIGIILMAVQIIHYARRQSSFYERSVLGEAKN